MGGCEMTANELADKLVESNSVSWGSCTYEQHDNDKYFKDQASTMLRDQQAKIEALKKKLENLPMSLKDDIEYWSEK
jgi:hypothetical protein